ncbi:MAG: galactitol-1-phosphate 5-dehydrogenase [Spirochaetota bacterium]
MQALVLTSYSHLEIQDVAVPDPEPGEVRVRVEAVGICGSDVHGYDGSSGRRHPPLIMGHEAAGVIDAVGNGVSGWELEERVTFDSTVYRLDDWYSRRGQYNLSDGREVLGVATADFKRNGCFAEYVTLPAHILYRVPDEVAFEHAALVEPYGVAMHAVGLADVEPGGTAAVVGCGTIGLCLIQILAAAGLRHIVAIDLDESRRSLALSMGATQGVDPRTTGEGGVFGVLAGLTEGRGADVAFEAVGASAPLNLAIESVRRGATVVLVGNIAPEATIPMQKIVTQQIRLQGSCAIAGEFDAVLNLLAAGRLRPELLVSKIAPLSEGASWFERLHKMEPGLLKVVLRPGAR